MRKPWLREPKQRRKLCETRRERPERPPRELEFVRRERHTSAADISSTLESRPDSAPCARLTGPRSWPKVHEYDVIPARAPVVGADGNEAAAIRRRSPSGISRLHKRCTPSGRTLAVLPSASRPRSGDYTSPHPSDTSGTPSLKKRGQRLARRALASGANQRDPPLASLFSSSSSVQTGSFMRAQGTRA